MATTKKIKQGTPPTSTTPDTKRTSGTPRNLTLPPPVWHYMYTGTAHGASPACPSSENLASQDTTGPQNQPNGVMPPGAPSATATASHDAVATSGMSESTSQPLPIQPMSAMGTNSPDGTGKTATPPGPQGVSSSHQPVALIEEDWIQCDLCNKWRKCSKSTLEQHAGEGKSWECSMNTSNATYASCDAPEEQ